MAESLPIHAVLPDLLAALRAGSAAVLVAPPGAGKTTAVAPALLTEPWCEGTVILLSPRRVAARAAAERMAELLGEPVGRTVGYVTRLDSRRSAASRIVVMTEAIFVSTVLADPDLGGISAVLFDEAHERHLDGDLGLALAIESAQVLRPDLRLLVMSATIDGTRFAGLLGDAPVIESAGKAFPLRVAWLGGQPGVRPDEAMAAAVTRAWHDEQGDILAFLPGVREIERTAERLAERLPQALVLPLHGQVEPAGQRAAIRRHERRRIVLATAIAETSVTLDGVSVVVDAGLARQAQFDPASGHNRLVTRLASQASAAQRAGRAARQGPGVVYRLWEEAAHGGRPPFDASEVLTTDLAPLRLALASAGATDPAQLAFLDPPPPAAWDSAGERLRALGLLDAAGRITDQGRRAAQLPLEPPLAHMVLWGAAHGVAETAARMALLLQERGLGGRSEDLELRLDRFAADPSSRAQAARRLAGRWARLATSIAPATEAKHPPPIAVLLAQAYPDHLARRRGPPGTGEWLAASGRGYRLDPASPLAASEWLVIGDAQGEAAGARITAGAALKFHDITAWLREGISHRYCVRWIDETETAEPTCERRFGAIMINRAYDLSCEPAEITAIMLAHLARAGLEALPLSLASRALLARAAWAGIAALAPESLVAEPDWVADLLDAENSWRALAPERIEQALLGRLSWSERQRLDRIAPARFVSPAGTSHPIDYAARAGPTVELRVQALFGLDVHPAIGDPARPLLLSLTSPAGRPLQTTADLPGFWRGSWADVRREMKGRYPKHRWPEQPWKEVPSLKTRNAFEAERD